jgi:hypothetical protein
LKKACYSTIFNGKLPFFGMRSVPFLEEDDYMVILLEKSILDGIGKGRKEMEDGGKFSFGVSPKFFDGIGIWRIGREVN